MLENKDIKFGVYWEDHGAARGFTNLDKEIEKTNASAQKLGKGFSNANSMLMSTSRIVQDLPYGLMGVGNNITFLAEQMGYARTQGISMKEMLSGMLSSLKGPMGIIFAISTATSLLTMFGNKLFGVGESTNSAKENVKSLRDEFAQLNNEVSKVVSSLNFNEIVLMGQRKRGLTGLISKTQQDLSITTDTEDRTRLSLMLVGYKSELEIINKEQEFQNFAFQKWLEMQKESNKVTKDTKENLKEITRIITGFSADAKKMVLANGGLSPSFANIMDKQNGGKDKAQMADITSGYKKNLEFMVDIMKDNLQIIKSEWNNMWEDVFGEANSLFEKFMSNMLEKLAEQALTNLAGSLLNMILPGAGSAFQALSGSPSYGGGGVIQNNIIIGERQVATIYTSGKQAASRLRM